MKWQKLLDKQCDGVTALCLSGEECVYQEKNGRQIPNLVYARISENGETVDKIYWMKGLAENFHPYHQFIILGDKIILGFRRQGQAFFYGFGFSGSETKSLVLFMKLEGMSYLIYIDAAGSTILEGTHIKPENLNYIQGINVSQHCIY